MRAVLQCVSKASVEVDHQVIGKISQGLVILLAVHSDDTKEITKQMAEKIIHLRIFSDEMGKMNRSLTDIQGEILTISQFTLYADTKKGRRPNFVNSASAEKASSLYTFFIQYLKNLGYKVEQGKFQAHMSVSLINEGPCTIILDSEDR